MNKFVLVSFLPLAMACTKSQPPATAKIDVGKIAEIAAPAPSRLQQVLGIVQYQDKCAEKTIPTDCLAVVGGDDLNEVRTFYLPGGSKNTFERIPSDSESKKFRIHTDGPSTTADVMENQHVALLAQLDSPTPDGNQRIGEVKSVQVVEK
jgi:hypothetical protein